MVSPADTLRKHLLTSLANGSIARGGRLPAERAMAEKFGLGRGAIRDALLVLESEGHVERKRGSGTYVGRAQARSTDRAQPSHLDVSPAHLMEARLVIEPQFAELVVANATASDFEIIQQCSKRTAAATSAEEFSEWNARLHQAIAAATRNEFLIQVFGLVTMAQRHAAWGQLSRRSTTPALRRAYQCEHDEIVAALMARNVQTARGAIANHLKHARRNLLGY